MKRTTEEQRARTHFISAPITQALPIPYQQCHHRPCIPTAHRAAAIESSPLRLGPIKRRSRESCHPCNHELIKACDVLRPSLSSINLSYPCALFNCLLRRASREENETESIEEALHLERGDTRDMEQEESTIQQEQKRKRDDARKLLTQAARTQAQGDSLGAATLFTQGLRLDPANPDLLFGRFNSYDMWLANMRCYGICCVDCLQSDRAGSWNLDIAT